METMLLPVISLIVLALMFDFINGFHDAANSVSTIIGTKTLKPLHALALAAIFNVLGIFIFHLHVAATIGKGIVDPTIVDFVVIGSALIGAIIWNLITWWYGLPSSSSHALIGGIIGAAVAKAGFGVVIASGITKVAAFIVLSPLIGFLLAGLIHEILRVGLPMLKPKDKLYRWGQIVSSCAYSLGHGTNDAQKTAGVMFLILVAGGFLSADAEVPYWVALVSFLVMGAGTLAGGWKIINTMAFEITDLKPRGGFAAETAGSAMLFTASAMGVPVSTTHTITGAIVGVGTVDKKNPVNWKKLKTIFIGWIFTIPIAALISASMYIFIDLILK